MHTDQPGRTQARQPHPGGGAPSGDPLAGRLLDGRYRIGALVARGGMASVYAATDVRLDRAVAVKVMHAGMGAGTGEGQDFAARFVREARAAARLSHPNVVAVFDQGDDDGVVYLAMELVEGRTLRDTIAAESPMRPERALALIEPVLSALASAHRAGLVHRDVKPENVLIADDGRIKVADFGLAKAVSADTQHTGTQGVLIGTVSYLAPELVVEGRSDARADVYAAGVVLYELLTGARPHEGESPIQVAYKHVHTDVPAPSRRVPGLPGYVDALIARATARDPDQRPADAAVLLHQVHRVAQALAEGVAEDAELALDLRPAAPRTEPAPAEPVRPGGGTSPEIFDPAEIGALLAPAGGPVVPATPEPTTTWERRPPAPSPAPDRPGHARDELVEGPTGPPDAAHPRAVRPGGRPRRRRGAVLLGLALVLAVTGVGGAYWFGWARYTSTPGVIGLAAASAGDRLTSAGLRMDVADEVYSETVPAGRVLRTDPAAGSRVLPGGTVDAVVSLGKERYDVPEVAGRTVDEAQDALTALSLRPDETLERFSETVADGTVIRARPGVGTTLRPGSPVDLVVSKGRRPVRVGSWVGQDYDDAASALEERGLSPVVSGREFDDTVPEGAVISQDPARGTAFRGEEVTFVVSEGPELVEVPGVVAYGVEAATEELESQGFEVRTEEDDSYVGLGFVVGTDPGRGAMVPTGSTITLFVV